MKQIVVMALVILVGALGIQAQSLSGNDILNEASKTSVLTAQGNRISIINFDITDRNDITVPRAFAFLSKRVEEQPNRMLVYFLEPELERGTIFLSVDAETPEEEPKIWLFLSALGLTKELISASDRNASFAGSNLTNDQLANGFDFSGDYDGELLGEAALELNWDGSAQTRQAYQVALTARAEAEVDFPTGTVWIDTETFVVLRAELSNDVGDLQQVITLDEFVPFLESFEANIITVDDVIADSQTLIRFTDRRAVEDLPNEIFTVEALPEFNPADYDIE